MSYPRKYCHDTILQLAKQGLTDLQVAIVVGCARDYANRIRRRGGVRITSRNHRWTKAEQALLLHLIQDGDRREDVAVFLNRSLQSVKARIVRTELAGKFSHYHNKIRLYSIVWLMWEREYSRHSIAIRLKLKVSHVSKIISRRPKDIFQPPTK